MTSPTPHDERRGSALRLLGGSVDRAAGVFGVTALVPDRLGRTVIAEALRGLARVLFCESRAHLVDATAATLPRAVILAVGTSGSTGFEMAVEELRSLFPTIALLAYCALTADAMRRVARAGRAHLNGVIIRGIDDAGPQLRAVLADAEDESVAATVMAMVADTAPMSVWPVLQHCLRNARGQLKVDELALALDVTRQALAKRLAHAGLPAASTLVVWCRLLHAARLMEHPRASIDAVALEMGFGSGTALRHALRRYTDLTPSEVRARGGLTCVLAAFRHALLRQRSVVESCDSGRDDDRRRDVLSPQS